MEVIYDFPECKQYKMSLYILGSWSYQSLIENSAIYNTKHPILMDIVVY